MAWPGDERATGAGGCTHMRASHADREQVIDLLKTAFVQGRLAKDEFDLRVGYVLASRTYADLNALTADIPTGLIRARSANPARKPARVPVPLAVRGAVLFMCLGAVLTLADVATILLTLGGVRSVAVQDPTAPHWPIAMFTHTVPVLAGASVGAGVWLWLAWANGRGHNWARFTFTMLFGLLSLGLFVGFGEAGGEDALPYTSPDLLATAALWLAGLAAMLLIFTETATRYYQRRAATRAATPTNGTGR